MLLAAAAAAAAAAVVEGVVEAEGVLEGRAAIVEGEGPEGSNGG